MRRSHSALHSHTHSLGPSALWFGGGSLKAWHSEPGSPAKGTRRLQVGRGRHEEGAPQTGRSCHATSLGRYPGVPLRSPSRARLRNPQSEGGFPTASSPRGRVCLWSGGAMAHALDPHDSQISFFLGTRGDDGRTAWQPDC